MINPFSILRLSIRESRKRPPHSDNCFSANLAGSYNLIVDKYTIKRSISQFSKIVICIRSFLLILYHSINRYNLCSDRVIDDLQKTLHVNHYLGKF